MSDTLKTDAVGEVTAVEIEQNDSVEFSLFSSPRIFGSVYKNKIYSRKAGPFDEPRSKAKVDDQFEFTLPLVVGGKAGVRLPFGLTIISGSTGSGKSTFFRALSAKMDIMRVLAVEPPDSLEELENLRVFNSADAALMALIQMNSARPVLSVLDSLREPLFETSGAAGSKGISMPFFTAITRVSNSLALNGLTILASVNPMDDDQDYLKAFYQKLSAAVPALIKVDTAVVDWDKDGSFNDFRFTGTFSARPNRTPKTFEFNLQNQIIGSARDIEFELKTIKSEFDIIPQNLVPTVA